MYVAPPGSERGGACVLIFGAKLTSYIDEPVVQLPCAFWGSYLGRGLLVGAWLGGQHFLSMSNPDAGFESFVI